jgi:hypothetical protein
MGTIQDNVCNDTPLIEWDTWEPHRLTRDYKQLNLLIKAHPQGFDLQIKRQGIYNIREISSPHGTGISHGAIYTHDDRYYMVSTVPKPPRKVSECKLKTDK